MEQSEDLITLLRQNLEAVEVVQGMVSCLASNSQSPHTHELTNVLRHYHSNLSACFDPERLNSSVMGGYFSTTLHLLNLLEETTKTGLRKEKHTENLIVYTTKLNAMVSAWERAAYNMPTDDLFLLPKDHDRWRRLSDMTEVHRPTDPVSLKICLEDMYKTAIWAHAFVSKGLEYTNKTMRRLITGFYVFYYSVNSMKAYHQARLNFANPSLESIVTLARCEDSVAVKMLESSPFKVATNRMIFICRESSQVSYKPEASAIPVRVISAEPLSFSKSPPAAFFSSSKPTPSDCPRPSKVVLHMHGGGFISMSSGGHLPYLQKWVLDNPNSVVFSVDYRLAPEHPYPAGLEDVWNVYTWLITHAKEEIDIEPGKVVVAGDSAGGHLAVGCTIRAIQSGVRVPDGLLLPYPALCMDPDHYTPSLTLALDDMVLNYTFLKSCLAAYLQDSSLDPRIDPMLSPIYAPISLFAKFPPTRVLVGTLDPLMDDCLRFAEKLLEAGADIRLSVFENIIHGGMNHMIKMENDDIKALSLRTSSYLTDLFATA